MDGHCNLREQHRRAVHSAKWTRGLDWLHETLRPITFRLLPPEIADRRGCWQEGYGFWGDAHLKLHFQPRLRQHGLGTTYASDSSKMN